ncbi:peptidylprolyl isomerase [Fusibacter sp. 3D3]|uniref:peptidylprolyl isomerase n=1 Tax=Fusibacter sp. 3D3 TaxID=1048380 RepID=UPI0035B5275C
MRSKINLFLLIMSVVFALTACGAQAPVTEFDPLTVDYTKTPLATIELETGEIIKVSLFPEVAPNTVNNFIELSQNGFYDGLTFHRVIPEFMIQGGDPEGTGVGNPGYRIKGEFNNNEVNNPLKHIKGVISMARSRDKDSAGSQFFIVQKAYPSLDGEYASFGYVIEGIEIVDRIALVERDKNDMPIEPILIKTIKVELQGYEPSSVVKLDLE